MKPIVELKLSDIMHTQVLGIAPTRRIEEAALLMAEAHVSCLVVQVDQLPVGILTERDVVRMLHQHIRPEAEVIEVMSAPVLTASPDLDFRSGFALLSKHNVRHLVIADEDGLLIGIVSETDFRTHLGMDVFLKIQHVGFAMDRKAASLAPDTPVSVMLERMSSERWDYAVVTRHEVPVGIVTERDIPKLLAKHIDIESTQVKDVMSAPVLTIPLTASVADAVECMAQHRIRHIIVVDEQEHFMGAISQHGLLERLGIQITSSGWQDQQLIVREKAALESRLQMVLDATGIGTWEYNHHTNHNVWSSGVNAMLGYAPNDEAATLEEWMERIYPEDQPKVLANMQLALSADNPLFRTEYRYLRADGRWLWVYALGRVIQRDSRGEPLLTSGIMVDISARKQDELLLQAQHDFAQVAAVSPSRATLLDAILDSMLSLPDLDAGLIYARQTDGSYSIKKEAGFSPQFSAGHQNLSAQSAEVISLNACPSLHSCLNPCKDGPTCSQPLDQRLLSEGMQALIRLPVRIGGEVAVFLYLASRHMAKVRANTLIAVETLAGLFSQALEKFERDQALREREEIYSAIINQAADAIVLIDTETLRFVEFNDAACLHLGYSREEFGLLSLADIQSGASSKQNFREHVQSIIMAGGSRFECKHRRKDGSLRDTRISTRVIHIRNRDYFAAIWSDITEQKRAEEKLKLAASVFQEAGEGIVITDADANIIDVNRTFTELTGYARDDVIGAGPNMLKSGQQDESFYQRLWASLLSKGYWRGEMVDRRKDGSLFVERTSIIAIKDDAGTIRHYIGIFSDVTEEKQQQERIERLAYYDSLTHLPNRILLADRMAQALSRADRLGRSVAVCYLDLDGFKPVNDQFGHKAGDKVLVEIAHRLSDTIRADDTVARLGGDEFVLLLTDMQETSESDQVLARVLERVAQPCDINEETEVTVSASIGVAIYPGGENDPDILMRHADQAMYQAKQLGRNRVHRFDPEHDRQLREHREFKQQVRAALSREEFILHWQPKVDTQQGRVIGAEALVRWRNPETGALAMPDEFLPFLEHDDLIVQLGDYVLDHALSALSRWRVQGLDLSISVNVAARQLLNTDFRRKLALALEKHITPPHRVELEILETVALEDLERVSQLIIECEKLGVSFALDDFGTGYSSMTYFRRLPVTTVKIDQSFVRDITTDQNDAAIVQTIIAMAQSLGLNVIAEGVETEAQCEFLELRGCRAFQGYLFGKPVPIEELERTLSR